MLSPLDAALPTPVRRVALVMPLRLAAAFVASCPDGWHSRGCLPSDGLAALAARAHLSMVAPALLLSEAALATYSRLAALTPASSSSELSSEVPSTMSPPPVVRWAALAARPRLTARVKASSSLDNGYAREALTPALLLSEPSLKAPLSMLLPLAVRLAARAALVHLAATAAALSASEAALGAYAYACLAALTLALSSPEPSLRAPSSIPLASAVWTTALTVHARLVAETVALGSLAVPLATYTRLAALAAALSLSEPLSKASAMCIAALAMRAGLAADAMAFGSSAVLLAVYKCLTALAAASSPSEPSL